MLGVEPSLWEATRQLIRVDPEWALPQSRQLDAFLRSYLNHTLAEQHDACYSPAVGAHAGEGRGPAALRGHSRGIERDLGGVAESPYGTGAARVADRVHRLLEDGENPNAWTVLAVWASDGVYAVVLEGEAVRAFTVVPEGEGYEVIEASET